LDLDGELLDCIEVIAEADDCTSEEAMVGPEEAAVDPKEATAGPEVTAEAMANPEVTGSPFSVDDLQLAVSDKSSTSSSSLDTSDATSQSMSRGSSEVISASLVVVVDDGCRGASAVNSCCRSGERSTRRNTLPTTTQQHKYYVCYKHIMKLNGRRFESQPN